MDEIIKKLEDLGNRVLTAVEERPFKSVVIMLVTVWLIGVVTRSLRRK